MAVKKSKSSYPEPGRLTFPEAETAFPWLGMLFNAYFTSDQEVYTGIRKELNKKKGRKLACAKGCSTCCKTHVTIPAYPLELLGIYWYLLEKIDGKYAGTIYEQMLDYIPGKGCPFLVAGVCSVHPMRPMACRFFNVFNTVCAEGEDPFYTRREDVFTPDEKGKNKALAMMLPYHGIHERMEKKDAIKAGYLHRFVKNMQDLNWQKIAVQVKNGDREPLFRSAME